MAIKQLTFSALTGGALVLAYAAWAKWRGGPAKLSTAAKPHLEPAQSAVEPLPQALTELGAVTATRTDTDDIDVVLDDLWSVDEAPPDSKEQLVDFSSDIEFDEEDDEVSVAPEGLGVRWLTRATEAMSPFSRGLSLREEAEAALREGVPPRSSDEPAAEDVERGSAIHGSR